MIFGLTNAIAKHAISVWRDAVVRRKPIETIESEQPSGAGIARRLGDGLSARSELTC